jgi:hypothetical protein
MVLGDDEPVVIEINPRVTTSYVGLSGVVNFNPAQSIVDAVLEHRLPVNAQSSGYAFFSKVKVPSPTPRILQRTYSLKELVTPPFPTHDDKVAFALIAARAKSKLGAEEKFIKAKERLKAVMSQR